MWVGTYDIICCNNPYCATFELYGTLCINFMNKFTTKVVARAVQKGLGVSQGGWSVSLCMTDGMVATTLQVTSLKKQSREID